MKTLREYIDLIEDKSTDPIDIIIKNSQKLVNLATEIDTQELDEVNWRKGLAGVAAAGALALGASGAEAARQPTSSEWVDMGYCQAVFVDGFKEMQKMGVNAGPAAEQEIYSNASTMANLAAKQGGQALSAYKIGYGNGGNIFNDPSWKNKHYQEKQNIILQKSEQCAKWIDQTANKLNNDNPQSTATQSKALTPDEKRAQRRAEIDREIAQQKSGASNSQPAAAEPAPKPVTKPATVANTTKVDKKGLLGF